MWRELMRFNGFIGRHKGKRIVHWFKSHLSKDSSEDFNDSPPNSEVRFWLTKWLMGLCRFCVEYDFFKFCAS